MSWPEAFALVGVAASIAAMAWAFAWMTVRTEADPGFTFNKPNVDRARESYRGEG